MIPLWVKWGVPALLLLASHGGAFWLGGEHSRKVAAKDKLDSVLAIVQDSNERQKKLQKSIDTMPRAENTIREIVKANPSNCTQPKPVTDGLQRAIDKANAARKMPRNP